MNKNKLIYCITAVTLIVILIFVCFLCLKPATVIYVNTDELNSQSLNNNDTKKTDIITEIKQKTETEIKNENVTSETSTDVTSETKEKILKVHFIDVGQGDSCLLESDGHFMLIDAGPPECEKYLLDYLKKLEVKKFDYVVATHPHADHIGSLSNIINNYEIDGFYMPNVAHTSIIFENVLDALIDKNIKLEKMEAGSIFYFNGLPVEILAPIKEYDTINNNSIVLKVVDKEVSFLFTGDIEAEAELDIVESQSDISADVLKTAHHGSDTSSTDKFVRAVSPKYAVISVGKDNLYNHPSESVLSIFEKLNISVFRTDISGSVIFETDGKHIEIKTETTDKNEDTRSQYYIGNRNSKKFHLPSCKSLPSTKNQIEIENREEAIENGFTPCKICKP